MNDADPPRSSARRLEAEELARRLAAGEPEALEALYSGYSAMLFGLAQRILGIPGEAEEVVQDVFLQAWRQRRRYDPDRASISTWLVLITRSRAIDRLRSRQVGERTVLAVRQEKGRPDTSPEGPGAVLNLERRRRLAAVLEELPEEQRDVLEKAFYAGMTQSEIAAATDTPLGTVKTRTLLAMKKLRAALAGEIDELL